MNLIKIILYYIILFMSNIFFDNKFSRKQNKINKILLILNQIKKSKNTNSTQFNHHYNHHYNYHSTYVSKPRVHFNLPTNKNEITTKTNIAKKKFKSRMEKSNVNTNSEINISKQIFTRKNILITKEEIDNAYNEQVELPIDKSTKKELPFQNEEKESVISTEEPTIVSEEKESVISTEEPTIQNEEKELLISTEEPTIVSEEKESVIAIGNINAEHSIITNSEIQQTNNLEINSIDSSKNKNSDLIYVFDNVLDQSLLQENSVYSGNTGSVFNLENIYDNKSTFDITNLSDSESEISLISTNSY